MARNRELAVIRLLDELALDQINAGQYMSDLEPQWSYDTYFDGKLLALKSFLALFKLTELEGSLGDMLPLNGNAIETLTFVADHVRPEILDFMEAKAEIVEPTDNDIVWQPMHPRIRSLAKPRYDAGFYADAVSTAVREVNVAVKKVVRETTGAELDGARLMSHAFSPNNPIIRLANLTTETGRNLQQGYMNLFQGAMIGIRNPKAHNNYETEPTKAIHLIFVASLLLTKLDERIDGDLLDDDVARESSD